MAPEAEEQTIDAVLGIDANLPRMDNCSGRCQNNPLVLCRHKFNFSAEIKYYNTGEFRDKKKPNKGWPDSRILLHFLDHIKEGIERGRFSRGVVAVLLTKDFDFIKDAEYELRRNVRGNELIFGNDFVAMGDIVVIVKKVDCRQYGTDKNADRKCIIWKMNNLFK